MYERRTNQIVLSALENQAAVVLLGPRQVGKTTLALEIAEHRPSVYLDLERAADRQILGEPDLYLDEQAGTLVILDEVQQRPGLFSNLAALAQSVLSANMCQQHHIAPLPMGYRGPSRGLQANHCRAAGAQPPVSQLIAFASRTFGSLRKAAGLTELSRSAGRCS